MPASVIEVYNLGGNWHLPVAVGDPIREITQKRSGLPRACRAPLLDLGVAHKLLFVLGLIYRLSGSNSVVECQLPKLDVAGSSPVSRSNLFNNLGKILQRPAPKLLQLHRSERRFQRVHCVTAPLQ